MFFTHTRPNAVLVALAALGIGLVGCGPEQDPEAVSETMAVYFESIGRGQSGAFTDTLEVVIRDSTEWDAVRAQLDTLLPFRDVDFSEAMVLLAAVPTPIGGSTIIFESVEDDGEHIIAMYQLGLPGRDCRSIEGAALPFQAVMVPRTDAPVRFEHNMARNPCTLD